MEQPHERFLRVLKENNLSAKLQKPIVRMIEDGAVIIEQPQINISFTDPVMEMPKEVLSDGQKQTTETVGE